MCLILICLKLLKVKEKSESSYIFNIEKKHDTVFGYFSCDETFLRRKKSLWGL